MLELWEIATSGANLIPTVFLGLALAYWVLVMIGALDLDFLNIDLDPDADLDVNVDVDLDLDVDVDPDLDVSSGSASGSAGILNSLLVYFNLGQIPVTILGSIFVLFLWVISLTMFFVLKRPADGMQLMLLIPYALWALFVTKFVTNPLKGFLNVKSGISKRKTIGQVCTVLSDIEDGRIGQGSVETGGAPLLVTISVKGTRKFKKGDKVLIAQKDAHKNLYYVKQNLKGEE